MRKILFCLIPIFLVAVLTESLASDKKRFKITRVYDGDTVMAVQDRLVVYVMLMGIDAPEISETSQIPDQPFGREAKGYLSRRILNKDVEIEGYGQAPFPDNNILGVIYLDGNNINLEMVSKGLAEAFEKELPKNFDIAPYLEAEKEARKKKLGMWSLGDPYISPSRWRQMHKLGTADEP